MFKFLRGKKKNLKAIPDKKNSTTAMSGNYLFSTVYKSYCVSNAAIARLELPNDSEMEIESVGTENTPHEVIEEERKEVVTTRNNLRDFLVLSKPTSIELFLLGETQE